MLSKPLKDKTEPRLSSAAVISELAWLGLKKDGLYYLENKHLLKGPRHVDSLTFGEGSENVASAGKAVGKRREKRTYGREDVEILSTILRCSQAGFSLEAIGKALKQPGNWALVPPTNLNEISCVRKTLLDSALLGNCIQLWKEIISQAERLLKCDLFLLFLWDSASLRNVNDILGTNDVVARKSLPDLERLLARDHPAHRDSPHVAKREVITPEDPYTVLYLPLFNRKGSPLGICYACRDGGRNARGQKPFLFDHIDQAVGVLFTEEIASIIDTNRLIDVSLNSLIATSEPLIDYLETLLKDSTELLGADRGDLFWLDEFRQQLVLRKSTGTPNNLHVGQPLPHSSLSSQAFRTGSTQLLSSIADRKMEGKDYDYYAGSSQTQSDIATPLLRRVHANPLLRRVHSKKTDAKSAAFAVVNLESHIKGYFDLRDKTILERLSIAAANVAETHEAIYDRIASFFDDQHTVNHILSSVERVFGFDEALLYVADYKLGKLSCIKSLRQYPISRFPLIEYNFGDDISFAARVFRDYDRGAICILDPWNDETFSKDGLTLFDIHGPVLGTTLLFELLPVGVLIAWSRNSRRIPKQDDETRFEHFARLSLTTNIISKVNTQLHESIHELRDICVRIPQTGSDELLQQIVRAITTVGFDRARIFSCDWPHETFKCIASAPETYKTAGVSIRWSNEQHDELRGWRDDKDLSPRILDPRVIPDPDAHKVGKMTDLPWAVAPIISKGQVTAYIAADCEFSRADLTDAHTDYLTVCASIASLVFDRH